MTRTGSVVTLEVAKQGAIYHGLATLLNQPSPMMQRGKNTHTYLLIQKVLEHVFLLSFNNFNKHCGLQKKIRPTNYNAFAFSHIFGRLASDMLTLSKGL